MKNLITKIQKAGKRNYMLVICFLLTALFSESSFAISDALKIKICGSAYSDETIIRFLPGATEGFDASYDAWKMFSPNPNVPNIFTKTFYGDALTINALPSLTTAVTTGLFLHIGLSGNYSFRSSELGSFEPGVCIMLFDQATGNIYNLRDTSAVNIITLPVISENDAARFFVIFSLPASIQAKEPTCMGCTDGEVTIKKAGWSNWQYTIKDSAGTVFASGTSPADSIDLKGFSAGSYAAILGGQFFTCSDSIPFHIYQFNTALGTTDVLSSNECMFNYYDGSFHIETNFSDAKKFTAQIIDLQGRSVWKNEFSDTKQLKKIIEVENLTPGIYVGMIAGNGFSSAKKILVSR